MFPYWTLIKYGIPFLIGAVIFGGAAWKIQGVRLDNAKATLAVCTDANAENDRAITAMKAEIEKLDKSCSARISSKDRAIKKLKQIDELNGGKTDEKENPGTDSGGDDIMCELNGMFKPDKKD
jgi:hypothetical protein